MKTENEITEKSDVSEAEIIEQSDDVDLSAYHTVHISDLASLGLVGENLSDFINMNIKPGGEGLYMVRFPEGFNGTLSHFKHENAYMGSGIKDRRMAQARLTQVPFDPMKMFVAIAFLNIQQKLNEISETQHEILEFLQAEKESELSGAIVSINEIFQDLPLNWDKKDFISQKISVVGDIKREIQNNVSLYYRQIHATMDTLNLPHVVAVANKKISKLLRDVRNYHNSVYILAYATYIETILLGNFNKDNLQNIVGRLDSYKDKYDHTIDKCHKWISGYLGSSVDYKVAPGLKALDDGFATLLKRAPFDFDKLYSADSEQYVDVKTQTKRLDSISSGSISKFAESVKQIDYIHNDLSEIYVDADNIYIPERKEEK